MAWNKRFSPKGSSKVTAFDDRIFGDFKISVPRTILSLLREVSAELQLPMNRLICIAIDNELGSPNPFNYPCLLPSNAFIKNAYVEEARKIAQFLLDFPKGFGRDLLMLMRRDIGIPDPLTFMHAYRELLESGVVEEVDPPKGSKFIYSEDYKVTRQVEITGKEKDPLAAKRRLIKRLQEEIKAGETDATGE